MAGKVRGGTVAAVRAAALGVAVVASYRNRAEEGDVAATVAGAGAQTLTVVA